MKKLLNTLYVTKAEAYLSKELNNVIVSEKGQEIFRIPIQNLEAINTFGYQGASPGIMKLCAENGVALSFFTPNGRFVSRIQGPVQGNVLLRKRQYELLNDYDTRLELSKLFITGKLYNSRVVLRRFVRDYAGIRDVGEIENVAETLKGRYINLQNVSSFEELRGVEGEFSALYFSVFNNLILNNSATFFFPGRRRRPPTDAVNAMLSFGYTLLANDCASALESVGLDPAGGFMHTLRPGRNSLALDMMEELRSYIVDRFVLSLINNHQLTEHDFQIHASDNEMAIPVLFKENGLKKFIASWQNRKKKEIIHPFLNEKISLGLLPYVQSMLLSRYLRYDIDNYPVFFAK